jgi:hypothetical protein
MGDVPGLEVLGFRIGAGDEEWGISRDPKAVGGQHDPDRTAMKINIGRLERT